VAGGKGVVGCLAECRVGRVDLKRIRGEGVLFYVGFGRSKREEGV